MTEFAQYGEWLTGILAAMVLSMLGWTIYYIRPTPDPKIEDDTHTVCWWRRVRAQFHLRLKEHKVSSHSDLAFFTGSEWNYRTSWRRSGLRFGRSSLIRAQEKIAMAAIRHPDGLIHTASKPGRHHHVIRYMSELNRAGLPTTHDQGFVTTHGRYVDRREGLWIARAAGQIIRKTNPPTILFSEDVW
jgi:hypothetical protein